jgi:outer membrane protein assembly factor BamB
VPSPLAVGDRFFAVTDSGVATLMEAKTGKPLWDERLGRHHDASPLLVNGLIYALADDGTTFVIRPGPEFELVAKNPLGEGCHATPAVADGALFFRTTAHLIRVSASRSR